MHKDAQREQQETVCPAEILKALGSGGLFAGVPCSGLSALIRQVQADPSWTYVPCVNEGEATALTAAARLCGTPSAAFLQNSGLGSTFEPLASLVLPAEIPVPLIISHREGHDYEEHHAVMGRITEDALRLLGLDVTRSTDVLRMWSLNARRARRGYSVAYLVTEGALRTTSSGPEVSREATAQADPIRRAAGPRGGTAAAWAPERVVALLRGRFPDAALIASTGYLSRLVFNICDLPSVFYLHGSMGYTAAFGLGVVLATKELTVLVLDGDGSALMHLGTLCTAAAYGGIHFKYICMDNGMYASTGGQPTSAAALVLDGAATAFGFRCAACASAFDTLDNALDWLAASQGPALLRIKVAPYSRVPPRITLLQRAMADRFSRFASAYSTSTPQSIE